MKPVVTDYQVYRFWFDIAQFALTGAIGFYVWFSNRARINHKRFVDLEKSVNKKITAAEAQEMLDRQLPDCEEHQAQTQKLEATTIRLGAEMRGMPSREEIRSLTKSVSSLSSKIAKLDGKFEGVNRAVDLINEHLINQGARK